MELPKAVSAQAVAVMMQQSGTTKGCLSLQSRFVKRGLTMSRQELLLFHVGANLAESKALDGWSILENNCWTDSMIYGDEEC